MSKNHTIQEMIEIAKNSPYGGVWYSDKGPIQINKDGELKPMEMSSNFYMVVGNER